MTGSVSVTVTFLFTDIEGSSRMWELDPATMDVALHLHNSLVSQVLRAHRGKIFKSMGDAFCCAFEDAADAVRAAIATQIELSKQTWPASTGPLRVRIGLHTGAATHDGNDYFGPTLNRVARIMSSAHGGQIVASGATFAVLGVPPDGAAFRDLGVKRLKDLEQPERLYQLVSEGLSLQFPPLRTLDEHPNNLPTQLSSFVGRRAELERIDAAFQSSRVVTIAGPEEFGKTRLALQFAAESAYRFPGGAFFVELANVTDRVLVPHAVAAAFSLAENGAEKPVETIARFIGDRSLLLIIDNSEHLLAEVATLIKTLASSCPNLQVLVTSREPLHLTGERVERLAEMSLPEHVDASELETSDGCRLFLERARAAGSGGIDAVRDAEAIVAICRRLEGIPLAIEIAASRTATLAAKKLAERLDAHLLVNKDPTVSERHRTLAKAIEWSFRLLEESEKRAFVAMSVFRGGCTAGALTAVAGFDAETELESLLDKSLVYEASGYDDEPRYRFSDPTREFSLLQVPEFYERELLARKHFEYALEVAGGSKESLAPSDSYAALTAEIDNVRAALDWSIQSYASGAAELVLCLTQFWRARSWFSEGRLWLEKARSLPNIDAVVLATLVRHSAAFAVMQDDYENADALAEDALYKYRIVGDRAGVGAALHTLAEVAHRKGRLSEADRLYEEALRHLSDGGHRIGVSICLINRSLAARQDRRFAMARDLLRDAEARSSDLDNPGITAQITIERGWLSLVEGHAQESIAVFAKALEFQIARDDRYGICQARLGLATAFLSNGDFQKAVGPFETVLRETYTLGAPILVSDAAFGISAVCAGLDHLNAAAALFAVAEALSQNLRLAARPDLARQLADELIGRGMTAAERAAAVTDYPLFEGRKPDAALILDILKSVSAVA